MSPLKIASEILNLFKKYSTDTSEGEVVSQASHMMQCALLAEEETGDADLVVSALLHDIGQLLRHTQPTESMDGYGVRNHEKLGAQFLRERGFSRRVCAVVEGHVDGKRYLVTTDPLYKSKLSEASLLTLHWQGGPMGEREARMFEMHPYFTDIIAVRRWDELGKNQWVELPRLSYFEPVILQHLMRQQYIVAAAA
jgi:2-amino-1-hydroxyethylphosphonate dioxygenase (glycine-forming)